MTKERLENYKKIVRERIRLEEKLAQVEAALYSPKIPQLTAVPPSGTPTGKGMEALADKHMELQQFYQAKLDELAAEQLEIEHAISSLDETARTVLGYHYIDGLTWSEVANKVHYCLTSIHNIKNKALEELERMEGE